MDNFLGDPLPGDNFGKKAKVEDDIDDMSKRIETLGARLKNLNRHFIWDKDTKKLILQDIAELEFLCNEIKILSVVNE